MKLTCWMTSCFLKGKEIILVSSGQFTTGNRPTLIRKGGGGTVHLHQSDTHDRLRSRFRSYVTIDASYFIGFLSDTRPSSKETLKDLFRMFLTSFFRAHPYAVLVSLIAIQCSNILN